MKQFNPTRLLLMLALLGWVASPALSQGQPAAKPAALPPAKAAPTQAPKPAAAQAAPKAKPKAKARKRRAQKPAAQARAKPVEAPAATTSTVIAEAKRRDPFQPLVSQGKAGPTNLPPGKAGLVISSLRIEGTVRAPNGMIAVVANPQERVYFLREGDRLYDGTVEKITLDDVYFHENTRDAFGRPLERTVVKRLYPAGEEQSGEQR